MGCSLGSPGLASGRVRRVSRGTKGVHAFLAPSRVLGDGQGGEERTLVPVLVVNRPK
jgi:hypothetical protein